MKGWRTGLCSVTFRDMSVAQVVETAAEAELEAIEWAGDVHVPPGDIAAARQARQLCADAGLVVSSYGSYVAPPDDGIDAFDLALTTTVALGCRHIRIWPGTRGRDSKDYSDGEALHVAQLIGAMGRMAAEEGVTIGLEYHPQSLTDGTGSAQRLMEAVGEDNVFLYWQPRPGMAETEALAEIARVGADISHLHVFAWDAARLRYGLGTQADAWRRYAEAVPDGRWRKTRYAMLEFVRGDRPMQLIEDAAVLRAALA